MYENKPVDLLFVNACLTPLTESEAAYYLREAYFKVTGQYPSLDSLAILWAQSALESGRWKSLFNHNWGNIKKLTDTKYTSFKCSEILEGKNTWFYPYHPQTFFAAWDSPLEGAVAYLDFVSKRPRYKKAWEQIKLGNPALYCVELKAGGYFTADLEKYTKGVVSLTNEFKRKSASLLAWTPTETPKLIEEAPEKQETVVLEEVVVEVQPEVKEVSQNPLLEMLAKILQVVKDLL